jgi:hypothetical protein
MDHKKPNTKRLPGHDHSCQAAISLIGNYLTGSIPPTVKTDFERHLHCCPDCTAFLRTYRKTIEATRAFLRNQPASLGLSRLERRGHAIAAFTFWLHLFLSHMSLIAG